MSQRSNRGYGNGAAEHTDLPQAGACHAMVRGYPAYPGTIFIDSWNGG